MLKSIAAHYVMRADDQRRGRSGRQRELLPGLVEVLARSERPAYLEPEFADDHRDAPDDDHRLGW